MPTKLTGMLNQDGTFTLNVPDGGANPFAGSAMVPAGQTAIASQQASSGYRARVNGVEVVFASEADYLKADKAVRDMLGQQNVPSVGGLPSIGGGGGGGGGWLRTGAHAVEAVSGFLNGRNVRRKIDDMRDALEDQRDALTDLRNLQTDATVGKIVTPLLKALEAERAATESALEYLEDQLTAIDLATGSGVAKVAADFIADSPTSSGTSGGMGSALLAGGVGLAVGSVLTRDDGSSNRRRRRR